MSESRRQEIAKKYVDKQLKLMKQHGLTARKISPAAYRLLVKRIAATVRA